MKTIAAVAAVLLLSLAVNLAGVHAVVAQDFTLPPPIIPQPPKLEVPKIPKLGEIPELPIAALPQRGSFSDRVSRCIDETAGTGLGPNERSAYVGACANR